MRVARILFCDEVAAVAGGANSLLVLLQHLDRRRFEPCLACPRGELAERARELGVRTLEFTFQRRRMFQRLGGMRFPDPRALLARRADGAVLARLLRECGADLLHTNSSAAHLSGCLAARRAGIGVVWHLRYRTSRLLYRTPRPDHQIFLSERFRSWALGAGRTRRGTSVIPNGIDADAFAAGAGDPAAVRAELGAAPGDQVCLSVGRLKPLKGQRELIDAFAALARCGGAERRWLWLAGEEMDAEGQCYLRGGGDYRRELEARARAAGVAGRVRFLGLRRDIARLLAACDLFALPSHTEAAPRVILEAMSMGRAVIASAVGGIPEQVEHGRSALLVPPRDVAALTAALRTLWAAPSLRAELGTAAWKRVRARFSASALTRAVEDIWTDLLRGRCGGSRRRVAGRVLACG